MPKFLTDLVLRGDPDASLEASTKQYVDNTVTARTPKITVGTSAPSSPSTGDVWIDTN